MESEVEILLTPEVKAQLDYMTVKFDAEVACWLAGEVNGDGSIVVDDILIPEQEVTTGDVDVKEEALLKMRKEYGKRCARIVGHFHSHCNMGNFWSAVDATMMNQYSKGREFTAFIVGSKRDYKCRVVLTKPFGIVLNDVKVNVSVDSKFEDALKKELAKKVTKKSWGGTGVVYGGYGKGYTKDGFNNWPTKAECNFYGAYDGPRSLQTTITGEDMELGEGEDEFGIEWVADSSEFVCYNINDKQFAMLSKAFNNNVTEYYNERGLHIVGVGVSNPSKAMKIKKGIRKVMERSLADQNLFDRK